jgi:molybdopterin-guanine dinucleotide biosynthesis protein A
MIPWAAMIPTACGILAGGASRRMGRNKALLPFRGKPLIRHQLDLLLPLFSEILLSANDPKPYSGLGLRVVPDLFAEPCSLSGIHALLKAVTAPRVFVVACDLPFLNPALIRRLLEVPGDFDVIVPESDQGLEPLHAIYSRSCIPAIELAAANANWKVSGFYEGLWVDWLPISDGDWLVNGRSPFTNANTPDDWKHAGP